MTLYMSDNLWTAWKPKTPESNKSVCYNRICTDVQHPSGVTNATGIHRHLDDLLLDRRRLARVARVQQESATGTALLTAAVLLLALPGLAMANNIRIVTVGTVQDLEDHYATRSRMRYLAPEILTKRSTSTSMRYLP
jgi:hypothetical protein